MYIRSQHFPDLHLPDSRFLVLSREMLIHHSPNVLDCNGNGFDVQPFRVGCIQTRP